MSIRLNDWQITEPSNITCYTNKGMAVVVEENSSAKMVLAKLSVSQNTITVIVNNRTFAINTESKIIDIS